LNSSSTSGASYDVLMAGALLTAAPPLIIYFVLASFHPGHHCRALKGKEMSTVEFRSIVKKYGP